MYAKLFIVVWGALYAYTILYTLCRVLTWILVIMEALGHNMPQRFGYQEPDEDRLSKAEIDELRTIAQSSLIVRKVILPFLIGSLTFAGSVWAFFEHYSGKGH